MFSRTIEVCSTNPSRVSSSDCILAFLALINSIYSGVSSTDAFLVVFFDDSAWLICWFRRTSAFENSGKWLKAISPILVLIVSYFSNILTLTVTSSTNSRGMLRSAFEEVKMMFLGNILSTPFIYFFPLILQLNLSTYFSFSIFISLKTEINFKISLSNSTSDWILLYFSTFLNSFQSHSSFFDGFFWGLLYYSSICEISIESSILFFFFLWYFILK